MTLFPKNHFIQNWSVIKTTQYAHAKKYIFKIKLWDCNFHQILPNYDECSTILPFVRPAPDHERGGGGGGGDGAAGGELWTVLYCTILYCTVLYYSVLYCRWRWWRSSAATPGPSVTPGPGTRWCCPPATSTEVRKGGSKICLPLISKWICTKIGLFGATSCKVGLPSWRIFVLYFQNIVMRCFLWIFAYKIVCC